MGSLPISEDPGTKGFREWWLVSLHEISFGLIFCVETF